ncbi:hypothetical protein B0H12DRAFT_1228984 [Mycena haematopus]|nr:hypothetical protein B0H12DRAFT_1228984 [Mycena haematopus]
MHTRDDCRTSDQHLDLPHCPIARTPVRHRTLRVHSSSAAIDRRTSACGNVLAPAWLSAIDARDTPDTRHSIPRSPTSTCAGRPALSTPASAAFAACTLISDDRALMKQCFQTRLCLLTSAFPRASMLPQPSVQASPPQRARRSPRFPRLPRRVRRGMLALMANDRAFGQVARPVQENSRTRAEGRATLKTYRKHMELSAIRRTQVPLRASAAHIECARTYVHGPRTSSRKY